MATCVGVSSLKGGTGKSTVTLNLATYFAQRNYKVCVIDTDTNQSSSQWSGLREKEDITVVGMLDHKQLARNMKSLKDKFDYIIIDGTPALSKMTSHIILLSDILIIPIVPSALDLWATEKFMERYDDAVALKGEPIPAYFLLNMFDSRLKVGKEVQEILDENDIRLLKSTLKNRVAYRDTIVEGLGVVEYTDKKAKKEINSLGSEIIILCRSSEAR